MYQIKFIYTCSNIINCNLRTFTNSILKRTNSGNALLLANGT